MAITNYLVHFKTEETFTAHKDELRNDAVAFVGNATIIHTHGTDYYCGKSEVALKTDLANYATIVELAGKADVGHTHSASDITSGTLSISRIPTGTSSSTVAVGNHTHSQYLTNVDLSGYVTDSELSTAINQITPGSINAATEDHTHVARDITRLTGYTEGSSTTTLSSSMDLNEALASLQNQIQARALVETLDDYALKTEIPDISNLATKTELADYLPLTGGTLSGDLIISNHASIKVETIESPDSASEGSVFFGSDVDMDGFGFYTVSSISGDAGLTLKSDSTGAGEITLIAGQKQVILSQGGFTYDGAQILTEANWDNYITSTDTKNTTGTSNSTSKLYLTGGTSQSSTGVVTYSNTSVYMQSGQLYATRMNATNGFYETSDANLKNFKDDIKSLDIISNIPTKYFTWKKDEEVENIDPELHIGTSAQEIQNLYPDLVSEDAEGHLTVDYARLSVVAIAAIKELKKEIEILKSKIN